MKRLGKDYSKIFPQARRFIVQRNNGKELPVYKNWLNKVEKGGQKRLTMLFSTALETEI